jgi:SEC-C motif-containing protein
MKEINTPEDLMRSRYEAFVNLDGEYLAATTTQNVSTDMSGYANIEWLKLDVIDAHDNEVEFKAYYREDGMIKLLHERSKFIKKEGRWLYESGVIYNSKIERNEPCPCGSGRKYKKCCA